MSSKSTLIADRGDRSCGTPDLNEAGWAGQWIQGATAVVDDAGKLIGANEAMRSWLGLEMSPGVDFWPLLWAAYPAWENPIASDLSKPGVFLRWDLPAPVDASRLSFRVELARHGGVWFLQVNAALLSLPETEQGASAALWEVVRNRQAVAEKRLLGAAWKETLAVLTMGLAHDFSNIMAGIHSISEDFQAQIGSDHPFYEGLGLIKRNSMQASQLIHRLVNLHRGKIGERAFHNLNDLMAEILELIRKVVPRQIRIESTPAPQALPIYADAVELRQVIFNLTLNAVAAMPQGGRLRFQVSRRESYPAVRHMEGAMPRLPSVCVSIEDEGCGIPQHLLNSVFDPFFTTKSLEKGSSLGLYSARLFADKHHGAITIDSEEKKGTVVCLWLPEADFTETEPQPPKSRRTVVICGQPGAALDSLTQFLRESGFSVATFSSAAPVGEFLLRPDCRVAAVLFLANAAATCYADVVRVMRRSGQTMKLIAQLSGRNEDELDSGLLAGCDLVLPAHLCRSEMLAKINALLEPGL